ncbi:MAG: septal ring lytic transglycosylase RlpA family protein [Burkholderiales bacterium]
MRAIRVAIVGIVVSVLFSPPGFAALETRTGKASFYAEDFHGLRTASGEFFDMNELTAAHPTYPFGTVVLVTNLRNDRQVKLRITDRGPTEKYQDEGRIIDVSRGAAEKLKFVEQGLASVRIEVLKFGDGIYRAETDPKSLASSE